MACKRTALDVASSYLARRFRTESEVRKHLAEKDYSASEIDDAVQELKAHKYIDDYEYALLYIEYGFEKSRSGNRIMRELAEKGVSQDVISFAYEDYMYNNNVDEYSIAYKHALKMFVNATEGICLNQDSVIDNEKKEKIFARIGRNLASRGFNSNIIYRVIDELGSIELE